MKTLQDQAREEFEYDESSGDFMRKDGYAGTLCKGYRQIYFDGRNHLVHRVIWLIHYGEWPRGYVDHINGDKKDNRIANLRAVNPTQSAQNRSGFRSSASGVKGVYTKNGKWMAQITINKKKVYLGIFDAISDASRCYQEAAKQYFGEYMRVE